MDSEPQKGAITPLRDEAETGPTNIAVGLIRQVKAIKDRSDMRCSAHWFLHERYARWALWLDLTVLGLSSWLVAMSFVEPRIGIKLSPFGIDSQIFVGLLSVGTFFTTIFQLRTDYKGTADAHKRTFDLFAEAKRQASYVIAEGITDEAAIRRVISSYDMACSIGVLIPDAKFLALKSRHEIKVSVSKYLSSHPSASIFLTRFRFWVKDNFGKDELDSAVTMAASALQLFRYASLNNRLWARSLGNRAVGCKIFFPSLYETQPTS